MSDRTYEEKIKLLAVETPFRFPGYIQVFGLVLLIMSYFSPVIDIPSLRDFTTSELDVDGLEQYLNEDLPKLLIQISLLFCIITTIIFLSDTFKDYRKIGTVFGFGSAILNLWAIYEINSIKHDLNVQAALEGFGNNVFAFAIGTTFIGISTLLQIFAMGLYLKYDSDVKSRIQRVVKR